MAAAIAVYLACFVKHKLARGERGMVLVLAASQEQARVVFGYAKAFLTESPVLRQEIDAITRNEIRLRNGITVAIHSNNFRTLRGRTLCAAVFDEVAIWRDETSAQPDVETYTAVLPSLFTTNGMLVGISTGYRRAESFTANTATISVKTVTTRWSSKAPRYNSMRHSPKPTSPHKALLIPLPQRVRMAWRLP